MNEFQMDVPLNKQPEAIKKAVLLLDRLVDPMDIGVDLVEFQKESGLFHMLVEFIALDKFQHLSDTCGLEDFLRVGREFYQLNYRMNGIFRYFHAREGHDDFLAYVIAERMVLAFGKNPALNPEKEMSQESQAKFLSAQITNYVLASGRQPMMDYPTLERVIQVVEALPERNSKVTREAAQAVVQRLRETNEQISRDEILGVETDPRRKFCKFMRDLLPGLEQQQAIMKKAGLNKDAIGNFKGTIVRMETQAREGIDVVEDGIYPEDLDNPTEMKPPKRDDLVKIYLYTLPQPPRYKELFALAREVFPGEDTRYMFYQEPGCRDYHILQLFENLRDIRASLAADGYLKGTETMDNVQIADIYLQNKGFAPLGAEPSKRK